MLSINFIVGFLITIGFAILTIYCESDVWPVLGIIILPCAISFALNSENFIQNMLRDLGYFWLLLGCIILTVGIFQVKSDFIYLGLFFAAFGYILTRLSKLISTRRMKKNKLL
jgi:uncharacterized membrane protein